MKGVTGYVIPLPVPFVGAMWVDTSPPTDFRPAEGLEVLGGAVVEVRRINPGEFTEDTQGVRTEPGRPKGYGHRDDLAPRGGIWTPQDYPTDCSYWGHDFPGGNFPFGFRVVIDLTFRGQIVDTCRGEQVVAGPREWTFKYNGVPD